MKIGIFGNSSWSCRLAALIDGGPLSARQLLVGQDESLSRRSLRDWLLERNLWACDLLHVIGWPMLWNLWIAARIRNKPVVLHWIGSDVLSLLSSPRWSRVAGPVLNAIIPCHLAGSGNLREELRSRGIYAKCEPLGIGDFEGVTISPLPERPCALAMLRPDKFEFYGGGKVLEMAAVAPEIHWLVVANDGGNLPQMPNVEYLGDVVDMEPVYRRTTVLVRLTEHDGTGMMPIEALARGRHVVWSHKMPFCRLAKTADSALREVRAAIASQSLNLEGAEYVRKEFDVEKHTQRLCRIYAALMGS